MKKFAAAAALAVIAASGYNYYENATVTKCHDDKILWIKVGETCVTEKRFG